MEEDLFAGIDTFEWHEEKAEANLRKHGIDFDEAIAVFYGSIALRRSDRDHEERWIATGETDGRIVSVVFTRRENALRIISARRARENEERAYRNQTMGRSAEGQD
jgi:uncharacterized protein